MREKILDYLKERPFIHAAAKAHHISPDTIYRWKKDNYDFRRKLLKVLEMGRKNLIDFVESKLIQEIGKGSVQGMKFFLEHNDKRYRPLRVVHPDSIIDEEQEKEKEREKESLTPEQMTFIGFALKEFEKTTGIKYFLLGKNGSPEEKKKVHEKWRGSFH